MTSSVAVSQKFHGISDHLSIGMAERFFRCHLVPHKLFEDLDIRELPSFRPGPDEIAIDPNIKYAAFAWHQGNLSQFSLERTQQLLRHPCRTKHPPAFRAVLNTDSRSHSSSPGDTTESCNSANTCDAARKEAEKRIA